MMKISRSGHYYKPKKGKKSDAILLEKIREVATEFPPTSAVCPERIGSRNVTILAL